MKTFKLTSLVAIIINALYVNRVGLTKFREIDVENSRNDRLKTKQPLASLQFITRAQHQGSTAWKAFETKTREKW